MTAWAQADYQRADEQDADRVAASPSVLQREHDDGAATAWQLTEHSAANGHSADYIEQRHAELSGPTADAGDRTPAETSWWGGYKEAAYGSTDLLREMEEKEMG